LQKCPFKLKSDICQDKNGGQEEDLDCLGQGSHSTCSLQPSCSGTFACACANASIPHGLFCQAVQVHLLAHAQMLPYHVVSFAKLFMVLLIVHAQKQPRAYYNQAVHTVPKAFFRSETFQDFE
jgi:hypothetical protein